MKKSRYFAGMTCGLLILASTLPGQFKVPENGWKLLQKGDGKTEGKRTLGWWKNEDGTITVGAAWAPVIPDFKTILGFGPEAEGVDPFDWPKDATLLEEGALGLRIAFKPEKNLDGKIQEHFWIYRQKGGVFLKVLRKEGSKFPLTDWIPEGLPVDRSKERLKELHDVVTRVKGSYVRLKYKFDPNETHEATRKRLKRVQMTIGSDGVFSFDGKVVDEKELEKGLSAAAQKFQQEKEVPKITIVLDIIAGKGVEFRFVEQVIQIAKKAGIAEASFTAFEDWEKWTKDE